MVWRLGRNRLAASACIHHTSVSFGGVLLLLLCCRPSYGDTELGYFNKFGSWEYIIRMNVELAKMAARGLTVMAGSGDAGTS